MKPKTQIEYRQLSELKELAGNPFSCGGFEALANWGLIR